MSFIKGINKKGDLALYCVPCHDIGDIPKGSGMSVTLEISESRIAMTKRIGKTKPKYLGIDRIKAMTYASEEEITRKYRAVNGRALYRNVLVGSVAAVEGGMLKVAAPMLPNGTMPKRGSPKDLILIINYASRGLIKVLVFRLSGYRPNDPRLNSFITKIKTLKDALKNPVEYDYDEDDEEDDDADENADESDDYDYEDEDDD